MQIQNSSSSQPMLPLNPLFLEEPKAKASELYCKSLSYKTLSIICIVASLAIFGVILALGLGIVVLPPWVAPILLALIFAEPFLLGGINKFWKLSSEYQEQSALSSDVAKKLEEIANWESNDIQTFATQHEVVIEESLTKEQVLRAIAYILTQEDLVEKFQEPFRPVPADLAQKIEEVTFWDPSKIQEMVSALRIPDEVPREDIPHILAEFLLREEIFPKVCTKQTLPSLWGRLGNITYPALAEAAFALEILSHPTLPSHPRDYKIRDMSLKQMGQATLQEDFITAQKFAIRGMFARLDLTKARQEIQEYLSAQALDESGSSGDAQNGKGLVENAG